MITVVLTGYKRPHVLLEQYKAVLNQTISSEIMVFINYDEENYPKFPRQVLDNHLCCINNTNVGVWGRFAFALNASNDFICMLDDDTIPGRKWLENCLDTIHTKEYCGLLGCRGVRITDEENHRGYPGCKYEGVGFGNENVELVDFVGHSWFFKKEWLGLFWLLGPSKNPTKGGEDMHFSYALQKYGINTFVPRQPNSDHEMWGSLRPSVYGEDMNATSRTYQGNMESNVYWNYIISKGFKLVKDRS